MIILEIAEQIQKKFLLTSIEKVLTYVETLIGPKLMFKTNAQSTVINNEGEIL